MLFNCIVDLLRSQEPHFDGNYLPALDKAEQLLLSNSFGSCALNLFFLSDGKPSDRVPRGTQTLITGVTPAQVAMTAARIDNLASRFGRRLTVNTVGFGEHEDFCVLQKLAERPRQFGSNGNFIAARLNPEALGIAFSSITSSLNATRSELTAIGTSSQRPVRDVRRRARDTIGIDLRPDSTSWLTYMIAQANWRPERFVFKFSHGKGEFVACPPLSNGACGIAMAKDYFGEGAERLVREFREVGPDGNFVGQLLVAKESRFQVDVERRGHAATMRFHRSFCDTQHRAQRLAQVFNEKLSKVPGFEPSTTPTISFLDCSVYIPFDALLGFTSVLVEKQLNPTKYKKWNDNAGMVDGQSESQLVLPPMDGGKALEGIVEASEEEEDSATDDEDEEAKVPTEVPIPIRPEDIPQAFSHFTYRFTKRKLLVCDLQGVLSSGTTPEFEFTDPVVHFNSNSRRNVFGRTDRGYEGIKDFFKTHKCSPLCGALNRRWVRKVGEQQRSSHLDGLEEQVSNLSLG